MWTVIIWGTEGKSEGGLAVHGALDFVVGESDSVHNVVRTTTNRADGQTMTTRANRVLERDVLFCLVSVWLAGRSSSHDRSTYSPGVDRNAIILVIAIGPSDDDVRGGPNVEAVGVVAKFVSITGRVVDSHISDGQAVHPVDTNGLLGSVLDVQVRDRTVRQVMGVEELGLCHTTVATLTVPPTGAIGVEISIRGALDGDGRALDLEQGSVPFFILPGCLTLENDLRLILATSLHKRD